jgi:hypothetical protein
MVSLTPDASNFQVPFSAPLGYRWNLGTIAADGSAVPNLEAVGNLTSNIPVLGGSNPDPSLPNVTTPLAPQMVITFDTIGQLIYAALGHGRFPFRYLWVQGVSASGDVVSGDTITFAAALCAPLDPLEEGDTLSIFDGAVAVFNVVNGITPPTGWDPIRQALLIASLATAVIYPGTEGQDPDPTILADKGPSLVSANRGIRYIVLQDYPANALPSLSVVWDRSNPNDPGIKGKKKKKKDDGVAVEFAPGSS